MSYQVCCELHACQWLPAHCHCRSPVPLVVPQVFLFSVLLATAVRAVSLQLACHQDQGTVWQLRALRAAMRRPRRHALQPAGEHHCHWHCHSLAVRTDAGWETSAVVAS